MGDNGPPAPGLTRRPTRDRISYQPGGINEGVCEV
jgi:hypothetical protein